jgi:hypothetical protein
LVPLSFVMIFWNTADTSLKIFRHQLFAYKSELSDLVLVGWASSGPEHSFLAIWMGRPVQPGADDAAALLCVFAQRRREGESSGGVVWSALCDLRFWISSLGWLRLDICKDEVPPLPPTCSCDMSVLMLYCSFPRTLCARDRLHEVSPDMTECLPAATLHEASLSSALLYPECNMAKDCQVECLLGLRCPRYGYEDEVKAHCGCCFCRWLTGGWYLFDANTSKPKSVNQSEIFLCRNGALSQRLNAVGWLNCYWASPSESALSSFSSRSTTTAFKWCRSVELLLGFASRVRPQFILLEIHDQGSYFLLDTCMFRYGVSFPTREGSVFLCSATSVV